MKKAYISPRTRHIDLSTESPLLDISMPVVREEGAGYDEVLTRRNDNIWGYMDDDK